MDIATRRLATRALRRVGLWSWHESYAVTDRWGPIVTGDVVFPVARLIVDLGSSRYPPGRRAALTRLTAAGWTLIDFEPGDLARRPVWLGREVRAVLDRLTPTRYS